METKSGLNASTTSAAMFSYNAFIPGASYGSARFALTPDVVKSWSLLFPYDFDGDMMPASMTSAVVMQAYHELITPRPPGNIHGGQRCQIAKLPSLGEILITHVSCRDKELRKGRRIVHLLFETYMSSGMKSFTSNFTSIVSS